MDFFGIIAHGKAFVCLEYTMKIKDLGIGDMIGFMNLSELTTQEKCKYDIIAETDGFILTLSYGEIKNEVRKFPQATYNILNIAARKSLEVLHYNIFGQELNPCIRHVNSAQSMKKMREFFFKNPFIRTFLKGLDRKDEKHLFNAMKVCEMDNAERLIRKGSTDRALIFVA
mmetsp:Transcript_13599/g.13336  ORF Transcript_13599/g.13336 Transcript_13599/m.13336 type:complete len:171 (+) Transcript_13599:180-692(+)